MRLAILLLVAIIAMVFVLAVIGPRSAEEGAGEDATAGGSSSVAAPSVPPVSQAPSAQAPTAIARPQLPAAPTTTSLIGDPARGKARFVDQSCVICHSVRGVGGRLAPPLDAEEWRGAGAGQPLEFAARMWRGAALMAELQRMEIGYQVDLTGQDVADLAAFAAAPEVQDTFSLADVPVPMQDLFLHELTMELDLEDRYRGEEWYDFSTQPRED